MVVKPFVVELAVTFLPALRLLLGNNVSLERMVLLTYSPRAAPQPFYEKLASGGWIQVLDRSDCPDKPIEFDVERERRPQVAFIEYLPEFEVPLLAEVARCSAAGVEVVIVATALKTPAGEARRQLEDFHLRHGVSDFYVYLLNDRGNLSSLYNELRRATSQSTKNN